MPRREAGVGSPTHAAVLADPGVARPANVIGDTSVLP